MPFIVVGKKNVDYFSSKKNARVNGVELYLQSCDQVENGEGFSVHPPIFFSSNKHSFLDFHVGDIVKVYYNRFGSVEEVLVVE